MKVQVAVADVVGGPGNPVCVRHGLPVVVRRRVRFVSSPPVWSYALIAVNLLIFLVVAAAIRKLATAPAWGYCDRCRSVRSTLLPSGLGVLALAVPGFVVGVSLVESDDRPVLGGLLVVSGFVLALVGLGLVVRGRWVGLSRGVVSRDGQQVTFRSAAPGFEGWAWQLPACGSYPRSYGYNPEAYAQYLYGRPEPSGQQKYAPPA